MRDGRGSRPAPSTTAGSPLGPDGRLYFSTGEAGEDPCSGRGSLNGKFLGSTPDRPRRRAGPEVFSLGHRNPQGFDWQPGSGRLVATEHGPTATTR